MRAGILVLAAGRAERFGSDKRSAALPDGRRVIDALLDNLRASGLPLLVCLGEDDNELAARLTRDGLDCVRCARAAEGMGGTLAEGIAHVGAWDGALVALADMPWIAPDTYRRVAAALTRDTICQPAFAGSPGHPVGFGAAYFNELAQLAGDVGGRQLLRRHAGCVQRVAVDDPAIHRDVDRPEDLSRN